MKLKKNTVRIFSVFIGYLLLITIGISGCKTPFRSELLQAIEETIEADNSMGYAPIIQVQAAAVSIPSGSTYDVDQSVEVNTSLQIVFTIKNAGGSTLLLSGSPVVKTSGQNRDQFEVASQPESVSIEPEQGTSFSIQFNPTSIGVKSAGITVDSNDPENSSFTFALTATAINESQPEIRILQNTELIPSDTGSFDMGFVSIGSDTHFNFSIENKGNKELALTGSPSLSLNPDDTGFSITAFPADTNILPDDSTLFTIRFTASEIGTKSTTLSIQNTDPDENPYKFTLNATGSDNPTVGITSTSLTPTNLSPIPLTITFSEEMSGFDITDIDVSNGSKSNFDFSGNPVFTADISPSSDGIVTAIIEAGAAQAAGSGKLNEAAVEWSIFYDGSDPTGTVSINNDDEYTNSTDVTLTLTSDDGTGSGIDRMMISNYSNFSGASWEAFSASKSWTLTSGEGSKFVYYKLLDNAGNESGSYSDSITLDISTPSAPSRPDLHASDDHGYSSSDNITNQYQNMTFSGTSEANATISLYSNGGLLGTTTANSSGNWSLDVLLWEGSHYVTAKATDQAGNGPSSASSSLSVTIDTTPPSGVPAITGPMQGINTGRELTPTFKWTSSSGAVRYTFQADNTSNFSSPEYSWENIDGTSHTPGTNMSALASQPVGTRYYLRVCGVDDAGNKGIWSSSRYINVGRYDDDFNGDGYSDVIVGAQGNDAGGSNSGSAYIYFGGSSMNGIADVTMTGQAADDWFGGQVASAGDVNGDGYADAIIGAPGNDAGGTDAGRAYIFYGGFSMNNGIDVAMAGQAAEDWFGSDVSSAGDVNGDGYDDIVVGAYKNDTGGTSAGRVYVFYGSSSMDNVPDVTMTGTAANDYFGRFVSNAGDVNRDGYADIIIGSNGNDAGGDGAGRAYVFYGGSSMNNTSDVVFTGAAPYDYLGINVSTAGDVNGDGYYDVIVGATGNDAGGSGAGRAYIYFGGSPMNSTPDVTMTGESASDEFGVAVDTACDVNNDGYDDVIVGAWENDTLGSNAGRAYIFFGGSSMNSTADVLMAGFSDYDKLGCSVACAGDVNRDRYSDVVVGVYYDDNGGAESGSAFIYFGSSSMDGNYDVTITGAAADDYLGGSVD